MQTIAHPDFREPDVRRGRERFYAQGTGPTSWLRVVVEVDGGTGEVVTAFGQGEGP